MRQAIVMLSFVVGCGGTAAKEPGPPRPDERIARVEHGLRPVVQVQGEDVRYDIEARMREYQIPAVGIAVFANYELQWEKSYGLADVEKQVRATNDTTFLAGSISKSVNALAQLQAVSEGLLSLDAPINNYLTSWKLPDNELTRAKPVTLRMLLSHTGGLTVHGFRGYFEGEAVPTIQQTLDGQPPANHEPIRVDLAPGTKFRYSGGGVTISQLALADRSKRPYAEVMAARVLRPLGMTHSSYDQYGPARTQRAAVGYDRAAKPIKGARIIAPEMAAAGLWTTAGDLARFFLEIARARAGKSKLISRQLALQMTTKVAPVDDLGGNNGVGLGVFLMDRNGTVWFGHGGGHIGFVCDAIASLEGGNGVVIMTSSENGQKIFGEIQRAVFAEYGWPGADPPVVRVTLAPGEREKLVGRYAIEGRPMALVANGDRLMWRAPFEEGVETVPTGPDRVVETAGGNELRLRGDGGLDVRARGGPPLVATRLDAHYLWLLEDGKVDAAVAALKKSARPRDEENLINNLGYQLMPKQAQTAISVLKLNAAAFPDSANAHDSLGEAYATSGDKASAIAEYKRARALLDADPRIEPANKPAFAQHVQEVLAGLEKP